MFETSKLRGRIIEVFGSQSAFAEHVGNSVSYVSQYLTGKVYLDQRVINSWGKALGIVPAEYGVYFFTPRVNVEGTFKEKGED